MKPCRVARFVLVATLATAPARAQVVVYDPAVVTRNSITAVIKEYLAELQTQQHSQLRRMAHRLSMFTDLGKFRAAGAPLWRIHDFENPELFRFARDYHAALNYGDEGGGAVRAVTQALLDDPALLASLEMPLTEKDGAPTRLARGTGCPECSGKGYRGRVAVFEVLTVSDTVRSMVLRRESSTIVKSQAVADGMRPMRASALRKVSMGITTPDEVARVILAEED